MASKCSDVAEDWINGQTSHDFPGTDKCTNRHSSSNSFRQQNNIGNNVEMLKPEKLSCTPKSTLNFVEYQQGSCIGTFCSEGFKPCFICYSYARFTLNSFHKYRCSPSCNQIQLGN